MLEQQTEIEAPEARVVELEYQLRGEETAIEPAAIGEVKAEPAPEGAVDLAGVTLRQDSSVSEELNA
jgi:hypothetical protein